MNSGTRTLFAAQVFLLACTQAAHAASVTDPVLVDNPDPDLAEYFGRAVATEGNDILIGAALDAVGRERLAGAAYLYDTAGNQVCQFAKEVPQRGDSFGGSVSLSADYALIGVPLDDTSGDGVTNAGAAYLFSRDTCELLKVFRNPDPQPGDAFGSAVSVSDNSVLIAALYDDTDGVDWGTAYLFTADPDVLAPDDLIARFSNPAQARSRYGKSVAVSATHALIGAPAHASLGVDGAGAAHVYEIDWTTPPAAPVPVVSLHHPGVGDPALGERLNFGISIALSGDRALIGSTPADGPGSAHLFSLTDFSQPVPPLRDPGGGFVGDLFGAAVALAGRYLLVGSPGDRTTGASFLFDASDGSYVHGFSNPEPDDADDFGSAVAMSPRHVVIGAYGNDAGASGAGSVYIYSLPSALTPAEEDTTLERTPASKPDLIGQSTRSNGVECRYEDGTVLFIGDRTAPCPDPNSPARHIRVPN